MYPVLLVDLSSFASLIPNSCPLVLQRSYGKSQLLNQQIIAIIIHHGPSSSSLCEVARVFLCPALLVKNPQILPKKIRVNRHSNPGELLEVLTIFHGKSPYGGFQLAMRLPPNLVGLFVREIPSING